MYTVKFKTAFLGVMKDALSQGLIAEAYPDILKGLVPAAYFNC